jgi:prepilin-type N-terminal cleavage/methylation domain-containing protein
MHSTRGFTVVEVLIAILILSVGLEMLRSQPCPSMSGGSTSEGRFVVTWTLQTVASGRAQAVTLVVESPTTRAMRADSFATTIPC